MKKTYITKMLCIIIAIFISIFLISNKTYSISDLKVIAQGSPVIVDKISVQNVKINFSAESSWKLLVSMSDRSLINISNISKQVSINRISIRNNSKYYSLAANSPVLIDSGNNTGIINKEYQIQFAGSDSDYPGNYTGNLQFILVTDSNTLTDNYYLIFNQPVVQRVAIEPNSLNIGIQPSNAMKMGFSQELQLPCKVLIQSNTHWKLLLEGNNQENKADLRFKITSIPENSYTHYNSYFTDIPRNYLVIAEGEPTVKSENNELETRILEVNYLLNTSNKELLPSGNYEFKAKYSLISQ